MKRTTAILAGLLAIALAGPARAADAPPDPAELLRRAQTTESADRDIPRAIDLYEAALLASKGEATAGVARDAALALLRLREARGEREEALKMAVLLWTDLAARLTPDQIPLVRAALGRLLAAGRSVTGPHGTIYVDDPRVVTGGLSPLEATIIDQLRSLKGLDGDRRAQRQGQIRDALAGVGRDALPALEKGIRREGPDIAPFAAELYAELGGVEAFPLLESLLRGADPFARAAAADAIDDVRYGEKDREAYVAGLSRLLDLPAVAGRRDWVRDRIASESTMEEVHDRAKAGGPEADWWLGRAIAGGHRPAIEQAIEQARAGRVLSEDLVQSLGEQYGITDRRWTGDAWTSRLTSDDLAFGDRLLVLDLLTAQAPSTSSAAAIASVAAACLQDRAGTASAKAADVAWRHALGIADPGLRAKFVSELAVLGLGVPPAVVRDVGEVYAQVLAHGDSPAVGNPASTRAMFGGPLTSEPAFWRALASALGSTTNDGVVYNLVTSTYVALGQDTARTPPPEQDALWVPLLDRISSQSPLSPPARSSYWVWRAAARSGDPRFLTWVRGFQTPSRQTRQGLVQIVAEVYHGPGRIELALDGLADEALYSQDLTAQETSLPEFWPAFFQRATRYDETQFLQALRALQPFFDQVLGVFGPVRAGPEPWGREPRSGALAAASRPEWIAILRRPEFARPVDASPIIRLAAATGSPEFLALVRERATAPGASAAPLANALVQHLRFFGADLPVEWIEGLLKEPGLPTSFVPGPLQFLTADPSAGAKAALDRLARATDSPAAAFVLQTSWRSLRPTILAILASAGSARVASWPRGYRQALVQASGYLRLREAIPFLLTQYQGDLESEAAAALDQIRAYHERLATFQSWATDLAEGRRDLSKLLADPDSEIRRAAVLSLGALGDRDALPALVRIAKEERDAKVRAAALEAVERIARSPTPAPAPVPVPVPVPKSE